MKKLCRVKSRPIHVNSRRARLEAQRTNPRGRTKRIIQQLETGIKGDYRNAREMRADNKVLVEQRFGNRKQRAADIRAAFGVYG